MEELITKIIQGELGTNPEAVKKLQDNYKELNQILTQRAVSKGYPEALNQWKDSKPIDEMVMEDYRLRETGWYQTKMNEILGMPFNFMKF